jgi:hypothetical protein
MDGRRHFLVFEFCVRGKSGSEGSLTPHSTQPQITEGLAKGGCSLSLSKKLNYFPVAESDLPSSMGVYLGTRHLLGKGTTKTSGRDELGKIPVRSTYL